MRFRSNLNLIHVDRSQRQLLDEFVKESIEEAARIWIRAATEKIPVWSGASRATLQALATAVDEHIQIDVRSTAPDRIALGRLYSRGGITKNGPGSYEFYYETSLRYLIANETTQVAPRTEGLRGRLIEPTPWEFREAGNIAVKAYFASLIVPFLPLVPRKI